MGNALFDNKNEDKIEEGHWKDVSIMMEGAKALAKVQPPQAEMRFMRTKSQLQVKGIASVVVKAMKEAFKWVVKMLKAAMKKAVDIMKAAFAKLQELAKKAFEQSLELLQKAQDAVANAGELIKDGYQQCKDQLLQYKDTLKDQWKTIKEKGKEALGNMKDKFKDRLKRCKDETLSFKNQIPTNGEDIKAMMQEKLNKENLEKQIRSVASDYVEKKTGISKEMLQDKDAMKGALKNKALDILKKKKKKKKKKKS